MKRITKPGGTLPKFKRGANQIPASQMNTLVNYARRGIEGLGELKTRINALRFPIVRRAKLIGYTADNNGFTARLISASGQTDTTEPTIELKTFRWPYERTLLQCVPKLDRYFDSDDPRAWVPVMTVEWCDPAGSDDSDCGATLFVAINFHGAGCS